MYGGMGGFGGMGMPPPRGSDIRIQKPEKLKDWIPFIFKSIKDTARRLLYIYKLVWDARPWILLLMTFMAVFNGVVPVIGSYISKALLDNLALAATGQLGDDFWVLGGLLVLQLGYQLAVRLIHSANNMINRISNEVLVYSIKLKIMNKAKTIDLASFDLPEFYSKLENANREAGNRPLSVLQASFSIVSAFISLVSYIVILGGFLRWAPGVLIVMAIPSAIIHYHYRKKMFGYVRRRSKDRRQMDYFSNLIVNKDMVKEIKLFNLADTFIAKYKEVFNNYFKGIKSLIYGESFWGMALNVVHTAVNGSVLVLIAKGIFDGILSVGDFNLYSGALFSISGGVSDIVNTSAGIYEGTLFIDNMIAFMEEKPTVVPSLAQPRRVERHINHVIEFKNVSFCYPGTDKKVLKNINLTIKGGETAVLVGLNGAGKTTLLKLLTRLYDPTEGVILFDGHDIREYATEDIYSVFGIIFQDFGKYAFTVGENISFGQIERKDDREGIVAASEKSSANEFIAKLSNSYDTPLTRQFEENGLELSIGQWQKIAVSRAFFRDSDIMILDEPTASLDPMAEQEIFSQFDQLRGSKTTIFVSHRLSSATIADTIIVLENGEIVEIGSHRELIQLNGKYAELFNTQAKRYRDNPEADESLPSEKNFPFPPPPFSRRGERPPRFEKE